MSRHQRVTTCRKGGPVSNWCSCEHCKLAVCAVCGSWEGNLTTDCPGAKVSFDKQVEVYETSLDYTDERGWHLGEPTKRRTPRFEETPVLPAPSSIDPRAVVAPSVDWPRVERYAAHQRELAQKAIAWVLADRACEDRSAALARVQDEAATALRAEERGGGDREMLAQLEGKKIDFSLSCKSVETADDEFRQAARRLVTALEETPDEAPAA